MGEGAKKRGGEGDAYICYKSVKKRGKQSRLIKLFRLSSES